MDGDPRPPDPVVDPSTARLNAIGHLGSAVGHHVINAYSAIVSNAEMLRLKARAPDPAEIALIADAIIQTALDASTVARRLIDYTRPITTPGPADVAIDRLVADFVEDQRILARPGETWQTALEPVPTIKGEATHLRAMLELLTANSREAAAGRPLTLSARTTTDARGWVVLEWSDDGPGMPPEILERAVEPFFTSKSGRIGVGLSVANGIWRRHRGTLSLKSRPGEGVTIRLCVEPPK